MNPGEIDLYGPIIDSLRSEFIIAGYTGIHLEDTHSGSVSNKLRQLFGETSIYFEKNFMPDIAGYYKKNKLVTVEVKDNIPKISYIYQAKSYADLVNADIGLLICTKKVMPKLKDFLDGKKYILDYATGQLKIGYFNKNRIDWSEWYPESPF